MELLKNLSSRYLWKQNPAVVKHQSVVDGKVHADCPKLADVP